MRDCDLPLALGHTSLPQDEAIEVSRLVSSLLGELPKFINAEQGKRFE
jgi:hypothetical protein